MPSVDCRYAAEHDLVPRYLARRLSDSEQEDFETHFLTCARCQEELQLGMATRVLLAKTPARPRVRWLVWGGIGGLAAAAALGALLLLPSLRGSEPLRALGAVRQSPLYLGVPIRAGAPSTADSLFEAAMAQYLSERYDRAAEQLERALNAGVDAAPAEF